MSIIVLHVVCERDLFTFVCMCILCTYVHMCGNRHYYILFFFLDEGTKQRVKPLTVIFLHHVWFDSEMSQRPFALFKVRLPVCGAVEKT